MGIFENFIARLGVLRSPSLELPGVYLSLCLSFFLDLSSIEISLLSVDKRFQLLQLEPNWEYFHFYSFKN